MPIKLGGCMRRQQFISLLGCTVAGWPLAAWAQRPARLPRLAVLMGLTKADGEEQFNAFRFGLQQLQWVENQNILIDHRWGDGNAARMRTLASELVELKPDVIVAQAATALREVQRLTQTIPIVFVSVSDPVRNKFVQSLSRPGGNTTGFILFEYEMAGKWLQLLREIAPRVARVMPLQNSNNPNWPGWLRVIEPTAPTLGLQPFRPEVSNATQIEPAIASFARNPNGGLLILPDPFFSPHRSLIIELAAQYRLPAVYGVEPFSREGGLISYSVDQVDLARRAASYVSRILKGENPNDLPVQAPTRYKLMVNLGTARALDITVPSTLLARADEVIE